VGGEGWVGVVLGEGLLLLLGNMAGAVGSGGESGSGLGMDLGKDWRLGEWNLACIAAATTADTAREDADSWSQWRSGSVDIALRKPI